MRSVKEGAPLAEAVRHPLRVRILEVVNEQDMAPIDFVNAGHADFFFGHRPNVSHIAYHFRELHEHGCIEPVAWRKARGSVATSYRGKARAEFSDEEWAALSDQEKRDISRTVAQGMIARIAGAFMGAETFLNRENPHLSWFAMQLDEQGWEQVHGILAQAFAEVGEARDDAKARLEESGETGLTTTAGIIFFESPPPAPPASS